MTKDYIRKVLRESIQAELMKETYLAIIKYIKGFGTKGKLPSCSTPLKEYYKPFLQKAYEWASEKVDEVKRNGFAWFDMMFRNYVINNFNFNKRGLIYVERSIDFDKLQGVENLTFSSVGECWSWKKHNSSSYCTNISSINGNKVNVVLCGYVHPDSIDWLETVYLNSYDMKNETEIRLNENAQVEVSYLRIQGVKIPLGGSYLLNASSDKYRKKDW